MELFEKIANGRKLLTNFSKSSILDIRQGPDYASDLDSIQEMSP